MTFVYPAPEQNVFYVAGLYRRVSNCFTRFSLPTGALSLTEPEAFPLPDPAYSRCIWSGRPYKAMLLTELTVHHARVYRLMHKAPL